jgi:IPT/TIG domain
VANFIADRFGVQGLETWQGTVISGDDRTRLPSVSINARSDNPYPAGIDWPPGTVLVHPLDNQVVVVGWRSPISGRVQVAGGVADLHNLCGDGVDWSVDKGATTLASGSVPSGGSQFFISAPAAANLENVAVGVGDVLYFVVGPGPSGNHICDSTSLDVTIRRLPIVLAIDSFTPTSGEVGTVVDIVGANFTNATNVTFNGAAATFTVESSTSITATVPNGAATGPISVTTPEGTTSSNRRGG